MKKSKKVFKKLGLFLLLALALLLLVRCEKDPLVVVPAKYTVEAFALNGTITPSKVEVSKGSDVILTVKANDGFKIDSVTVNGVNKPLTGNTLSFLKINSNYKIEATGKITELGLLIQKPWKEVRWQARLLTETNWDKDKGISELGDQRIIFDGVTFRFKKTYDGALFGDGPFELKQDSLIIGGGIRTKIIELSETTLIIEGVSEYFSAPYVHDHTKDSMIRITYKH